jgi:hypothetical protein
MRPPPCLPPPPAGVMAAPASSPPPFSKVGALILMGLLMLRGVLVAMLTPPPPVVDSPPEPMPGAGSSCSHSVLSRLQTANQQADRPELTTDAGILLRTALTPVPRGHVLQPHMQLATHAAGHTCSWLQATCSTAHIAHIK